MGWTEWVWDAFATTIKLTDKVEQLNVTVIKQQHHIEDLVGRGRNRVPGTIDCFQAHHIFNKEAYPGRRVTA